MYSSVSQYLSWKKKHRRMVLTILVGLVFFRAAIIEGYEDKQGLNEDRGILESRYSPSHFKVNCSGNIGDWFRRDLPSYPMLRTILTELKFKLATESRCTQKSGTPKETEEGRRRPSPVSRARNHTSQEGGAKIVLAKGMLLRPVVGCLTSPYGRRGAGMHWGIDLAAPEGSPVQAVSSGTVVRAGWATGYGMLIVLDHGEYRTLYAHNSRLLVNKGEQVMAGEVIAQVGKTGKATGYHLHFEVEVEGVRVNPLPYLEDEDEDNVKNGERH